MSPFEIFILLFSFVTVLVSAYSAVQFRLQIELSSRPYVMADTLSTPLKEGLNEIHNNTVTVIAYQSPAFITTEIIELKTRSGVNSKVIKQFFTQKYLLYPEKLVHSNREFYMRMDELAQTLEQDEELLRTIRIFYTSIGGTKKYQFISESKYDKNQDRWLNISIIAT